MTPLAEYPELTAQFLAMRRSVSSIAALEDWLRSHPEVFNNGKPFPEDSSISFSVSYYPGRVMHNVRELDCFSLNTKMEVVAPVEPPALLSRECANMRKERVIYKIDSALELGLVDWPLATALAVAYFVDGGDYRHDLPWIPEVKQRLDRALSLHFPAFTIDKLLILKDTGILPASDESELRINTHALAELLMSGGTNTHGEITLPIDVHI